MTTIGHTIAAAAPPPPRARTRARLPSLNNTSKPGPIPNSCTPQFLTTIGYTIAAADSLRYIARLACSAAGLQTCFDHQWAHTIIFGAVQLAMSQLPNLERWGRERDALAAGRAWRLAVGKGMTSLGCAAARLPSRPRAVFGAGRRRSSGARPRAERPRSDPSPGSAARPRFFPTLPRPPRRVIDRYIER